jgi:histidyl-tRNA synthetase
LSFVDGGANSTYTLNHAQVATGDRSLRAQLRAANQAQARYALIIGDQELAGPELSDVRPMARNLATGEQQAVTLPELWDLLKGSHSLDRPS